jgi:hypothetical protein
MTDSHTDLREQIADNFMQCMADVFDGDSSNETAYAYADNVIALISRREIREQEAVISALRELVRNDCYTEGSKRVDYVPTWRIEDRITTLGRSITEQG